MTCVGIYTDPQQPVCRPIEVLNMTPSNVQHLMFNIFHLTGVQRKEQKLVFINSPDSVLSRTLTGAHIGGNL